MCWLDKVDQGCFLVGLGNKCLWYSKVMKVMLFVFDKILIVVMLLFLLLLLVVISLVQMLVQIEVVMVVLKVVVCVGFDIEFKLIFYKGQIFDGLYLVQFVMVDQVWLFQICVVGVQVVIVELLYDVVLVKIGFGLVNDISQLVYKFGIYLQNLVDLDCNFCQLGYCNFVGVKGVIVILFGQCFIKFKWILILNWVLV